MGPFNLTFRLDASFQGPHGGQEISLAVVRTSNGAVVARGGGSVSATEDPAFTFSAGDVPEEGIDHEVHYWIDSNFGGGTLGVCDPRAIDHQWSTEILQPSNDVTLTVLHDADLTEDVCTRACIILLASCNSPDRNRSTMRVVSAGHSSTSAFRKP